MEHDVLACHAGRPEGPGMQQALSPVVWHSGIALIFLASRHVNILAETVLV